MFRKLTEKEIETRKTEPHGPMRYSYWVRETLERRVTVVASSEEEAYDRVHRMYSDCEIELMPDDWVDTEFELDEVGPEPVNEEEDNGDEEG